MRKKFGFIGAGNMGSAIMKGLLRQFAPSELVFTDADAGKRAAFHEETSVDACDGNGALAEQCEILVLAVKPQFYEPVLADIRDHIRDEQIIISIAPGKTIGYLMERLGGHRKIVRCMPNTPALIREGMTGVSYDRSLMSEEEQQVIDTFFHSFGQVEYVPEHLMDAVVCVSGSSPAYVYMFIEALADSAVRCGLPRQSAYHMAAQAVLGSAKMVLETGLHPGILKDNVCSPAGTTIEAVAALEAAGFRNAVMAASEACFEKCREMAAPGR